MSNNLPQIWRFAVEDYISLGDTFKKFISNLNLFTLSVYNLLNGGLGFANMQRAIYRTTVTAGALTPVAFVNPLPISPSGVTIVQAQLISNTPQALTSAISAANWQYDGKTISILNVTGLVQGGVYNLAFEVA